VPGFKRARLDPGPLRDLADGLHQLHLAAGCPSVRDLQRDIGTSVASHTSVYKQFTSATLPRWGLLELLVEAMARRARVDGTTEVERFRQLWVRAAGPSAPPRHASAPPCAEVAQSSHGQETLALAQTLSDLLPNVLDEIEAVGSRSAAIGDFRIPTGFDDLDSLLGGWQQGCLAVIGGWPASGKTTLLLNFCRAASIKYKLQSMFISGEMNRNELQSRLLAAEARVPLHYIRTGQMDEDQWTRLARTMAAVVDSPIRIGTPSKFELEKLNTDAAALVHGEGLKLLIVDGLEWMTNHNVPPSISAEFVLWRLKRMAETLQIPIIVSAQAARSRSESYRPPDMIQNLKAGDAIERVADVVLMLYRPDQDDSLSTRAGEADLIITKNRNGQKATITVCYQGHYSRFISMEYDQNPLFPTARESTASSGAPSDGR
jgi:replicative DNA helicase